jgi:type II secretory pathway component PulM
MSERMRAFWSAASPRERGLLVLGALVVACAAGYAMWQPLQRDLEASGRALSQVKTRSLTAQHSTNEIAGLKREEREPRTVDARAAAERIVDAQGLRSALAAVDAQAGRVRLTFAAIEFGALVALLDRLAQDEQLFPVEAMLAAQVVRGTVRAELSLARPSPR